MNLGNSVFRVIDHLDGVRSIGRVGEDQDSKILSPPRSTQSSSMFDNGQLSLFRPFIKRLNR